MFDLSRAPWCNENILQINRLAPRAYFMPCQDEEAALSGTSARVKCLSGSWKFRHFTSALLPLKELLTEDTAQGWDDIDVPRSWQFAGYGKFLYTDEAFPFPLDPPYIPAENETGVYRRTFSLSPKADERYILRLDGAESCCEVYVNSRFAGYTQGSRLPAEFDITPLCAQGENALCLVVRQYSDGTYLEDQDMWWLGGLIRDVHLITKKRLGIDNLILSADYCARTGSGTLTVSVDLTGGGAVRYTLYDARRQAVLSRENATPVTTLSLPQVTPWNAEEPYLYTLLASLLDEKGAVLETVRQQVGFRRVEIKNGVLLLNDTKIMLRGVNRHEFSPKNGRAVTYEETKKDLLLMKKHHINAVRTSHYPDAPFFYDLCDELGLYVMDECDLETHGFEIEGIPSRLVEDAQWKKAYLDRAERTLARDRNHACVIMWSLGNESFWGSNFFAMYDLIKAQDPTRPIHYEGDRMSGHADVTSSMYSAIGLLHELDVSIGGKPHILCEFCHAMGNGPGSITEYVELIEHSRRIQGYFIWEWRDHGVRTERKDGLVYYRYGGEFSEDYTSGNFCMDGLLAADGTPTPGFFAFSKAIEPLHIDIVSGDEITLSSRFAFHTVHACRLVWTLRRDGAVVLKTQETLEAVAPQSTFSLHAPPSLLREATNAAGHSTLTLECLEDDQTLGTGACVLQSFCPAPLCPNGTPAVKEEADRILVGGEGFSLAFSLSDGRIKNYCAKGKELIKNGPALDVFRAYLDNDRIPKRLWEEKNLHSMAYTVLSADCQTKAGCTLVTMQVRYGANARNWRIPMQVQYRIYGDGTITVRFAGRFEGDFGTAYGQEVPRLGTTLHLPAAFHQVLYLGCGPDETYVDSRQQGRKDVFSTSVSAMSFPYECPQDSGNRTDTDWIVLHDGRCGLAIASLVARDVSVHTATAKDIWKAAHHIDIPTRDFLEVHIDKINSGLGSGSCGPQHLRGYSAQTIPFDFSYALTPSVQTDPLAAARHAQDVLAFEQTDARTED